MSELNVIYNAYAIGYDPAQDNLESAISQLDPPPTHTIHVPEQYGNVTLDRVIAIYETDDPAGLAKQLAERYRAAIVEMEEGSEMRALDE